MKLTSSALIPGQRFDDEYTVAGQDHSPPLAWSDVPASAVSLVLLCDDPDAPSRRHPGPEPWVHWVLFNIPTAETGLPAGMARALQPATLAGARQGVNSWPTDNVGYRGPAPPPGSGTHRYFFRLYALDISLALKAGATKAQVVQAMQGHILAEAELMATYER